MRVNEELEELFEEWAELLQVAGTDRFRARAYERAGQALGGFGRDLRTLTDGEILAIPSVGKHMAARVREYLESGTMHELEDLRELVPAGMRDLLRVPGLGPKKAMLVHRELGVGSIDDLHAAVQAERLRGLKGLGAKTEENIARALENLKRHGGRILVDQALATAEKVIARLAEQIGPERISYAGSLRRRRDSIGDLDILVARADAEPVMDLFTDTTGEVIARGGTKASIVTRKGLQIDLRVVTEDVWGAALMYFTGSKAHNIRLREMAIAKGWKLSEWGLTDARTGKMIASETEEQIYDALGLPFIPPVLREDSGELEAAREGRLPSIVTEQDIIGDLHSHTDLTDGRASLEEMVTAAVGRGYQYLAVTDHAEGLSMTGVGREAMLAQRQQIAKLQKRTPQMQILHGCELNIGRDGEVDYDPEFLAGYDVLVASVHSHFRLGREETTRRLIAAMENPYVNVIGHPSGRLIGRREPIDLDLDAVIDAALRTGTALEVNCFPDRLDLRDAHVRAAVERGVTLSIDTDSHAPRDFENLRFGVATAQRGWATPASVLNTRPVEELRASVAAKRAAGGVA